MSSRYRVLRRSNERTHGRTSGGSRPARGQRTATRREKRRGLLLDHRSFTSQRARTNVQQRWTNERANERSHFLFGRRANCTWNLNQEPAARIGDVTCCWTGMKTTAEEERVLRPPSTIRRRNFREGRARGSRVPGFQGSSPGRALPADE